MLNVTTCSPAPSFFSPFFSPNNQVWKLKLHFRIFSFRTMRERGGPRGSTSPFVAALLVCLVGSAAGAGLSCREKGFGDSLQCSSCKQLSGSRFPRWLPPCVRSFAASPRPRTLTAAFVCCGLARHSTVAQEPNRWFRTRTRLGILA